MIRNHNDRIPFSEPRQLGALISRHKNSEFFSSWEALVDLEVVKKIQVNVDVATVIHARESACCPVATGLTFCIRHAQIVIRWISLRHGEDGDITRDNGNLEGGGWGLLDGVLIVEGFWRRR